MEYDSEVAMMERPFRKQVVPFRQVLSIFAALVSLCSCDQDAGTQDVSRDGSWQAAPRILAGELTAAELSQATWVRVEARRNGQVLVSNEAVYSVHSAALKIPSPGDVQFSIMGFADQTKVDTVWIGTGTIPSGNADPGLGVVTLRKVSKEHGLHGITIISPNGGEIFNAGDSISVRWIADPESLQSASVTIRCGSGNTIPLVGNSIEPGSASWGNLRAMIPTSLSGSCQVRIWDYQMSWNFDTSDTRFTVNSVTAFSDSTCSGGIVGGAALDITSMAMGTQKSTTASVGSLQYAKTWNVASLNANVNTWDSADVILMADSASRSKPTMYSPKRVSTVFAGTGLAIRFSNTSKSTSFQLTGLTHADMAVMTPSQYKNALAALKFTPITSEQVARMSQGQVWAARLDNGTCALLDVRSALTNGDFNTAVGFDLYR